MEEDHPHSGAAYRIVEQSDLSYGVEVTIPGTFPTIVTGFATEAAAVDWAARHKDGVARGVAFERRWTFRKPRSGG
jgi:hypothetical protein